MPLTNVDTRFTVGSTFTLPSVTADAAEMLSFAQAFDPQPIHLSAEAAVARGFSGLVASGWYVCGLFMRQFVTHVIAHSSALVSPGLEQIRWRNPLIAGTAITGTATVTKVVPSLSVRGGYIATFEVTLSTDDPAHRDVATLSMHCLFDANKE